MSRLNLDVIVVAAAFVLTSSGAPTAASSTLADLGGELCEDPAFTCLTLDLPVNHFDPSDDRTLYEYHRDWDTGEESLTENYL